MVHVPVNKGRHFCLLAALGTLVAAGKIGERLDA